MGEGWGEKWGEEGERLGKEWGRKWGIHQGSTKKTGEKEKKINKVDKTGGKGEQLGKLRVRGSEKGGKP